MLYRISKRKKLIELFFTFKDYYEFIFSVFITMLNLVLFNLLNSKDNIQ